MSEVVRVTITGVNPLNPLNTFDNILYYFLFPEPVTPITVSQVIAFLDSFSANVWENDVLPIVSDSYVLTSMQGDVLDTTLPAPHLTDVIASKTSFAQTVGQRVGSVGNIVSSMSLRKNRSTRVTKSGGMRLGPVLRGDWLDNQPQDPGYRILIDLAATTLTGSVVAGPDEYFPVIWGAVIDVVRPVPVLNGIDSFEFIRLTTQRSRLD